MKTQGIVLSRRNSYNEDVFLTIFTEKYGKMNVVAKRAKSYRSVLSTSTRVFVCSDFILKPASTPVVYSADPISSNFSLLDDLNRIANASYAAELIMLTTREEFAERGIYILLKQYLHMLCSADSPNLPESKRINTVLLRAHFVVNLCRELGLISADSPDFREEMKQIIRKYRLNVADPERLKRFLDYLAKQQAERLNHTRTDEMLFYEAIACAEALLTDFMDIPPIKSRLLLDGSASESSSGVLK